MHGNLKHDLTPGKKNFKSKHTSLICANAYELHYLVHKKFTVFTILIYIL